MAGDSVVLFRPTGPEELALVAGFGWTAWPPRLPEQPIFYPVLTEEYAVLIARDWNVPASGVGHVTRSRVARSFLDSYEVHQVGGQNSREYWIPAEEPGRVEREPGRSDRARCDLPVSAPPRARPSRGT